MGNVGGGRGMVGFTLYLAGGTAVLPGGGYHPALAGGRWGNPCRCCGYPSPGCGSSPHGQDLWQYIWTGPLTGIGGIPPSRMLQWPVTMGYPSPVNSQTPTNIWLLPHKCAKINFLSQTRKLCSYKICFDKNDCNENLVFSWTYWDLARTNETSQSLHFICRYIHEASKALYYVFEFKCSKVIRIKKLVLGPCLSYKILRIAMLRSWQWFSPVQGLCMITGVLGPQFLKGESIGFSQKLNIMKLSLSLSLPCKIFCWKPFLGACLYAGSHSRSLDTYEQTQKRVHLYLIVLMYVMIFPYLPFPYKQAPKTGFKQNISQGREGERKVLHMCSSRKMCKTWFPITKQQRNLFWQEWCNENLVFSWTYWDLARTNETSLSWGNK